ncbi:MAG TPA: hypothetical protein PLV92_26500, partial [Pirellulaceae bacterium]|nr:hypothetical protein [Pirellulaceae bacterium]
IPDSGEMEQATPTPGAISVPGQMDEWTLFLRADQVATVTANLGGNGPSPAMAPLLTWGRPSEDRA